MKRYISYILIFAMLLVNTINVYAQETNNLFFSGGIDIKQEVYEIKNGKKQAISSKYIYAGQEKSYVVDITNRLSEAYIRVDVSNILDSKESEQHVFTGISSDWVRKSHYYYYTKPVKTKEKINFCTGLLVPEDMEGKNFSLTIVSEAVQAYGVNPDFNSENPFEGIPIESTKVTGEIVDNKSDNENSVEFDTSLAAIIDNKDFFSDFGVVMPGQVLRDSFNIKNNSNKVLRVKMYLTQDSFATTPNLNKVGLTIKKDGKLIYEGTLYDEVMKNGLTLGTFIKGSNSIFEFEVRVPKELTNEDALTASLVKWRFGAEYVRYGGSGGSSGGRPGGGSSGGGSSGGNGSGGPGDTTTILDDPVALGQMAIDTMMYEVPDPSLTVGIDGSWELIDQEKHLWKFKFTNGTYASNGWLFARNPYYNNLSEYSWYHFDGQYMSWGWIKGKGDIWYYGHNISDGDLGTLVKGWHYDNEDGKYYYLDPITGIMHSGWSQIDGEWYYFAKITDTYKQNWFWNTTLGRWLYDLLGDRSYGSMYASEITPDGYYVNDKGIWEGED